ncbi:PH domain-containing protein [Streptomyces sp. TR06-5]|uniref:PH domain-containing protein n=1 Tax=Streptomyces sp. TR06-5 TaxID=3385976 RepID=UPI0039A28C1D
MSDRPGLTFAPPRKDLLRVLFVIGVVVLVAAAVRWHLVESPTDEWAVYGSCLGILLIISALHSAGTRLHVDACGVRIRTPLRQRSIPWRDVMEIQVSVETILNVDVRGVTLLLRSGQARKLPVPHDRRDPHFDLKVAQLRAFHRDAAEA